MLNLDTETSSNPVDKTRQWQVNETEMVLEVERFSDNEYGIYQETMNFINELQEDQQATFIALMYLSPSNYDEEDLMFNLSLD